MQAAAKRLVAIKTRIIDLQASEPARDPNGPTGLTLPNGILAYRFNLIGAVVTQPEINESSAAFIMDDGTGSLVIRAFENPARLSGLNLGDILTVIGRPRPASDGIFLAPEIIKTTPPAWIAVRAKEIERLSTHYATIAAEQPAPIQTSNPAGAPTGAPLGTRQGTMNPEVRAAPPLGAIEEEVIIDERAAASPERRISDLIKKNDPGPGADAATVISESGLPNADAIIDKLLKNGDIFAVGPGRYKVLD